MEGHRPRCHRPRNPRLGQRRLQAQHLRPRGGAMTQTLGPWEADEDIRSVKVRGCWQSKPSWTIWPVDLDQHKDGCHWVAREVDNPLDARLIAAAPQMLEALKLVPTYGLEVEVLN